MSILPQDAVLPRGSTILVTGANGYIGSHVINQLLKYGYKTRGTVRDVEKSAWLQEHFDKEYGIGNFEPVEVKEITKANLLGPLKGCAGIVHVASDVSFSPDPGPVIAAALALTQAALEASAETPTVKRFVQTSSSAAVGARLNEVYDITPETWNDLSVEESRKPGPYGPDRMISSYSASKTLQERSLWEFMKEKKPGFVANAVLPEFTVGKIINVEKQGYPSSISVIKAAFEGNMAYAGMLPPQYEIDVEDCALLHVAALLSPDAKSERVFGYAYPRTLTSTMQYLKELYPERTFAEAPKEDAELLGNVTARARAQELLQWIAGKEWTSYKDSIKLVTDTLI